MSAATRTRRPSRRASAPAPQVGPGQPPPALPPEWRLFVGRWLESTSSALQPAARGDWEVDLAPALQRRWRRQRVRLVFDPQRATLPRGAWFTAPGSTAGRKLLEAALEQPVCTRLTALAQIPAAPEAGLATVCRVRGLSWGPARLGPVRYVRRVSFHGVLTRWGGLPLQEPWVVLMDADGALVETTNATEPAGVRTREGLYQISDEPGPGVREGWMERARGHWEALLSEREQEWEREIGRHREDELGRLGAFFSARIEEEEERLRRRTGPAEESDVDPQADSISLKLEWERRVAEVRQRWAVRTEIRVWGVTEWSWPVADLQQELRAGAVHVRLHAPVDAARGLPAQPACPSCGTPAEMLVRARGAVACVYCAPA